MTAPKPEIRRHCKKCGNIYRYSFQVAGIPRCPKCWGYEYGNVEYLDGRGKIIKNYHPSRESSAEFVPCVAIPDRGCKIATDFLGKQSECRDCPFPECLDSLPFCERDSIRQWRVMIQVYQLKDEGLQTASIIRKSGVSRYLIDEWIKKRDFFEPFIKQPEMVGSVK